MSEKREFFRITDRLEIEFREIDRREFVELEREIKYRPSQLYDTNNRVMFAEEGRIRDGNDKEMVITYLRALDRKVSAILETLSRFERRTGEAKLFTAWYGEVSISAIGLSMVMQAPIHTGTLMHLKLMLPIFPYPMIQTLCEVVRQIEVLNEASRGWRNAVKFLVINDLDRDLLISYIFDKEREQIRLRKALDSG